MKKLAPERKSDREFAIKILNSWPIHKSDTEFKVEIRNYSEVKVYSQYKKRKQRIRIVNS